MTKHLGTVVLVWTILLAAAELATEASPPAPRYAVPTDFDQLQTRLGELRAEYAPYLRSLPEKAEPRPRTLLSGEWQFTFEVKDPPKKDTPPPPAPEWYGVGFDDSAWETTTVPEWRYRTVGHDNLYTRKVDQVQITGDQRSTSNICWYRRTFHANKPDGDRRLWLCFDGVEWEAHVYLNGERIGSHCVYHEPFRFDVTDQIKSGQNTLAVRVINGPVYGEPIWAWTIFPDIRAERQRYTPDRAESIQGNLPIGYHCGGGFGIWRDVYLETTGPVRVDNTFVRNDLSDGTARVKVELDAAAAQKAALQVRIMPENCEGPAYEKTIDVDLPAGASVQELFVPMPDAKVWSPQTPNLYRCRVTVAGDTKDVLFGCRSFSLVHHSAPRTPAYTFEPTKARWLRIVGRGSDLSPWNSIWEVEAPALVRDPKAVAASGQHKDYPAALAIDGKDDTRWAVEGDAWIQFQLDPTKDFDKLTVGWYEAHRRNWDFDLMVSDDGEQWTKLDYARADTGPSDRYPNGMLVLNGKPCYLRGTNVQGFNAYAYWGQTEKLIDAILMLKAGHFNSFRACQHVQMPEVREMLDRLGIMSEQDQGAGGYGIYPTTPLRKQHYLRASRTLARITYNNPSVVLLSLGNEGDWPTADAVRAGLEADPQRIFVPISGRFTHSRKPWDMPEELLPNAIDDGHPYAGWYGGFGRLVPQTWGYSANFRGGRMIMLGEFGAEALDAYETMKTYPPQFAPPPPDADTLWASSQVQKHDFKQIVGLGRKPTCLAEYIEASQNYQEALLADRIIQMRLLPRGVAGYFHFHFMDVVPVFWPKSIVSHDHRPKKAYYQIAQINQPFVVLPRLSGHRPDSMTLWVCNDLDRAMPRATVSWTVSREGKTLIESRKQVDVAPIDATQVETIDLKPVTWKHDACDLHFTLTAADGRVISHYRRQLRCIPKQLLGKDIGEQLPDPFND